MSTTDNDAPADLWSTFLATAARGPQNVAVTASDGTLTFGQIEAVAVALADALTAAGVTSDAVVHLALANSAGFVPTVLALRKIGATIGLVSSRYRDAEFRALTERVPPTAYLTTPQLARVLDRAIDVRADVPVSVGAGDGALALVFPAATQGRSLPADIALVKFTSGSTGAPKGVGLTEANLLAEAANVVATLGIGSGDRILVAVPVSHSYGFDLGVLPLVAAGAQIVLRKSFVPREVLADLANTSTSVFLGVPSMYRILAETPPAEVPDLSHVRYMLSCTAPLLPSLVAECHERLGVAVCQHYGSSETGAAANHRPDEVLRRPGSVGVAAANVEVRVIGEGGETLGPDTEGEITIRSAAVARGYVTDEAAGSDAFVPVGDGRYEYRTGDIGVIDADGFIYWRGRKDQVINVGGLKVYPSEIVQVLERCPSVSGARVVAGKDPSGEQVVHAVVTVSQSIREQDIIAFCRHHLADYKVPRRVEIAESISTPEATKMSNLSGDF